MRKFDKLRNSLFLNFYYRFNFNDYIIYLFVYLFLLFRSRRYRRTLTTPKRSHLSKQQQQHGQQHPSPLTEQHRPRSTQPSQHGDVMLPAPQQNQHSLGQGGTGNSTGTAATNGPVHVIYHLDNIPTPFHAKWTDGVGITLGTFKDQVFARKGDYRYVYF